WQKVMSPDPVPAEELEGVARNAPLTRPRPGHADLVGMQKYGYDEARPILERASARETDARVALGEVARQFLRQALGVEIVSHVVAMGSVSVPDDAPIPAPEDLARVDADPVRCFDPETSARMVAEVDDTRKTGDTLGGVVEVIAYGLPPGPGSHVRWDRRLDARAAGALAGPPRARMVAEVDATRKPGDTLGGVVEVIAYGLPPGLGSHVHWDRRLDARLAGALMGIQAIKGVEFGDGFRTAARRGSAAHDEIDVGPDGMRRRSNRAGGVEGGMSTGDPLRVRAAMKPIATVPRALDTIDVSTGQPAQAHHQRSDVTAVPAAGVVAEALVALVLADAALEKFGGDSVAETVRNLRGYLDSLIVR